MRTLLKLLPPALILGAAAFALPAPARAQLVVGQYEPEAPAGTWNSFPFWTAPSLAMGGTVYASAAGPASALANPASAARLSGLRIGLDASLGRAEFFRFGPVNTGVLTSRENLAVNASALDWGGVSFKRGRWAVALNAALTEIYDRPRVDFDYAEGGRTLYSYDWTQTGFLRTVHVALARELRPNLTAGIGLGILSGRWELSSFENLIYAGYAIRDERERGLSGIFLSAGLLWEPRPSLRLGLALRSPLDLKADSRSSLSFAPAGAGQMIVIRGSAADKLRQPAALGAGASWALLPRLRLAVDLTYLNWASYEPDHFGEAKARDFRDVLRAGAGIEYAPEVRFLGKRLTLPLRSGFIYDPQPMKASRSAYRAWTVGAGAALEHVSLDIGACLGSERGSGRNLKTARVSASLGVML